MKGAVSRSSPQPVATADSEWRLVKTALTMPAPLGVAGATLGVVALAGYVFGIEGLYRPVLGGTATHPLAAISGFLLGLGLAIRAQAIAPLQWIRWTAILTTTALVADPLLELVQGVSFSGGITLFADRAVQELIDWKRSELSPNAAFMLFSIAASLAFNTLGLPNLSQLSASVSLAVATVALSGYAYGIVQFHHAMSLLSATVGFWLSFGALATTADRGALRAILSPHIGGRLARMQVLAGYLTPMILAYILITSSDTAALSITRTLGIFSVVMCWFIVLLAGLSAMFYEKVDLQRRLTEAKLERAAHYDALTGLANRRHFFEQGGREMERLQRYGGELWGLMLDVDHFKNVNDSAGHAIGDRVLVAVATTLADNIRAVDVLGRMGGEEFAVLAVAKEEGCRILAEKIRLSVESMSVAGWTELNGPVTVSIGCAQLRPNDSLDELLHRADMALYQAKQTGRNRVVFSTPSLTADDSPV
jgi:diguanylate cyclase (GGDEF)-like protein